MSHWKDIRGKVLVADLATTDPNVEATQTPHASMVFVAPSPKVDDTSENLNEMLIVVYAYSDAGGLTKVSGTVDVQVLERDSDPIVEGGQIYVGRDIKATLVCGRAFPFSARKFQMSVRLSNPGGSAATADHLRVFYRSNR
jgi:hypothetical protein